MTVLGTHRSEIWGHAPFGAGEAEFEDMMDVIDVNEGRDPSPTYTNACHTSLRKLPL